MVGGNVRIDELASANRAGRSYAVGDAEDHAERLLQTSAPKRRTCSDGPKRSILAGRRAVDDLVGEVARQDRHAEQHDAVRASGPCVRRSSTARVVALDMFEHVVVDDQVELPSASRRRRGRVEVLDAEAGIAGGIDVDRAIAGPGSRPQHRDKPALGREMQDRGASVVAGRAGRDRAPPHACARASRRRCTATFGRFGMSGNAVPPQILHRIPDPAELSRRMGRHATVPCPRARLASAQAAARADL